MELHTVETFNSCLLNLYHDRSEGIVWRSDGETDLKKHGAIASLSFGAQRRFSFKQKRTKVVVSGAWLHRLAPIKQVHEPRVTLTFGTITERCTGR